MPPLSPDTPIAELARRMTSAEGMVQAQRILKQYRGKAVRDIHAMLSRITVVDCAKDHERSTVDPQAKEYSFNRCTVRVKNAACGHCLFSPLGRDTVTDEDDDRSLSARMVVEDAVLLMEAAGHAVPIPEELYATMAHAAEELNGVDVMAIQNYAQLFGVDYGPVEYPLQGETLVEVQAAINAASRPLALPLLRFRDYVHGKLEDAAPQLRQ